MEEKHTVNLAGMLVRAGFLGGGMEFPVVVCKQSLA